MGFSFVVTVYNKRPFLPRVLASVEAERAAVGGDLVVVDDGSSDGSREWLGAFGEGRARFRLVAQANAGVAAATNRGLAECTASDVVRLVDADDLLVPGSTAALARALHGRPDAVAAFGTSGTWDLSEEREVPPVPAGAEAGELGGALRAALRSQLFVPTALLARRAALERCGPLDERFRHGHDLALSLRLARLGPILRLPAEVCRLARDPGGLSASRARLYAECARVVANEWGGWSAAERRYAVRRTALRAALYTRRHLPPSARTVALHGLAWLARGPWRPSDSAMAWVAQSYASALADPTRYP